MLVYIHVPFCVRKCGYCAFHSGVFSTSDALWYMDLLMGEMAEQARWLGGRQVESIYFGGGTPSLLHSRQLGAALEGVFRCFDVVENAEITVEGNPESVARPGFLPELRALGVNRLSLGVQSLHDETLRLLGRAHDSQQAIVAVDAARSAGFDNLSLDLIWACPGQSLDMWLDDLAQAMALGPDHLSCYGLSLEPGTILNARVESGELTVPDEDTGAEMFAQGVALLEQCGLVQYEISNFSRPGHESRHNAGYWAGQDYLGLGPGAVSTLAGRRWTNPTGLSSYAACVGNQGQGRDLEELSADTRRNEKVMLALRTRQGLNLNDLTLVRDKFLSAVEPLCSSGLVCLRSDHLYLTRKGMLVSNLVIGHVLEILACIPQETYD